MRADNVPKLGFDMLYRRQNWASSSSVRRTIQFICARAMRRWRTNRRRRTPA